MIFKVRLMVTMVMMMVVMNVYVNHSSFSTFFMSWKYPLCLMVITMPFLHRFCTFWLSTILQDIMHEIRTQGPVEAVMEVYTDFFMYASGVYQVQMMTMSVMSKKMMMMRMIMLMMIIITVMEFMFRLCKKLLPPI